MRATSKGQINRIELSREELWALLSFAGDSEHYSVVHFRVNGRAKLEAAATDGKRSVEAIGKAEGAAAGEWAIDSDFLEKCRASVDKDESLVLELTEKGVRDALVVDTVSGDTICRLGWKREVANTQMSLGEIVTGLKIPTDKRHTGSWCAIDPEVLRGLTRIRVATDGCPVTLYPPSDPTGPLFFEARCDAAHYRGAIMPERVLGPGDEADEPEEDAPPGAPAPQQQSLFGAKPAKGAKAGKGKAASAEAEPDEDEDDGIVDDDYEPDGDTEPPLATEKPRKGAKKAAKKASKRGK